MSARRLEALGLIHTCSVLLLTCSLADSFSINTDHSIVPRLSLLKTASSSGIRLPSFDELNQEVEALARVHGCQACPFPPTTCRYSDAAHYSSLTIARPTISTDTPPEDDLPTYSSQNAYSPNGDGDPFMHDYDGSPGPSPDGDNCQRYTTEQGDFIIYALHDMKLKWQRIKDEFDILFGRTPDRTVQGLQAWYYRMNEHIPVWDEHGFLLFENENALEPKYISNKCREYDSREEFMNLYGLAQRYPERAIGYSWVDQEFKRRCRDWGTFAFS